MSPHFVITFVLWPRRLFIRTDNLFEPIGWVFLQKARLVNNVHYGWIAVADDQTPERLSRCPCCNRGLLESES